MSSERFYRLKDLQSFY